MRVQAHAECIVIFQTNGESMNPIIVFIVLSIASIVYWDATRKKIGKVEGEKGLLNMSAGGWALASIYLFILAVPAYLLKRKSLIKKAETHPVEVKGRSIKLALLIIFCLVATSKNLQTQKNKKVANDVIEEALN